jgi:Fe-S oxidoreductase
MTIKNILFIFLFIAALSFFVWSCRNLIKYMLVAKKKDDRFDKIGERIMRVLTVAFGQSKLLRDPIAGSIHFVIFWGFILFLFAVLESILQGFYSPFSFKFLGPLYIPITLVQDVFGLLVIIAIALSLVRRFVFKVKRLEVDNEGKIDAVVILLLIMVVCISMFGQNISHVAKQNFILEPNELRPISSALSASLFTTNSNASIPFEISWWVHIVTVFGFLNYLPYSKHLHVLTSIPNTFFANVDSKRNTLQPLNLDDENAESFGSSDIDQMSWKQILDGYSCTECGRCSSVCPAATVGKSLSPRKIIVDIRRRTGDKAPLMVNGVTESEVLSKTLVHDYITDSELWACTTCNACVHECPVMIEHVDLIVDLRRNLVLTESNFPNSLNNVFKSIETNFTPWVFNQADRANWAEGMNIKTMAEDSDGEILFWVGCAGSFDSRYKKVTQSFASIMQKANVDFRILGTEEKCNGDTARRLGNEYLAQMMMKENIETLNKYGVKKIVTACPHCFHSLGREYKQFGGDYEVIHHSQLIDELISSNRVEIKNVEDKSRVTYHDSCYIGRYNNIYDEPRNILRNFESIDLTEMKRNKSRGFCCGAGGGRMFFEDEEGGRINVERTNEALETKADTIASACPFCMTMLTDGVKHYEKTDEVSVKDIAEIVLENIN